MIIPSIPRRSRPRIERPKLSYVATPENSWHFWYDKDLEGLGDPLTFTRANAGWAWGSTGNLIEYAANEPRFWHNPVTGESEGLLIEPADTELLGYTTRPMDWVLIAGAREAAGTGILGQFNAAKITSDGTNRGGIANNISITSGTTYTIYYLYRAGSQGSGARFLFYNGSAFSIARGDLGSVTVAVTLGGTVSVDEQLLLDGVTYLGKFTWTPNATSAGGQVRIECLDVTNGDELIVLGRNVVEVDEPYSFIVNTSSGQLMRSSDACSWTLPSRYMATGGETWVSEIKPWTVDQASPYGMGLSLRGGSSEDVFMPRFQTSTNTYALINNSGFQFEDSYTGADAAQANEWVKSCLSYGSVAYWSINGLAAKEDLSVSSPPVDTLWVGRYFNGNAIMRGTHRLLERIPRQYYGETVSQITAA